MKAVIRPIGSQPIVVISNYSFLLVIKLWFNDKQIKYSIITRSLTFFMNKQFPEEEPCLQSKITITSSYARHALHAFLVLSYSKKVYLLLFNGRKWELNNKCSVSGSCPLNRTAGWLLCVLPVSVCTHLNFCQFRATPPSGEHIGEFVLL